MDRKFKIGDKVVLIGDSFSGCFPLGSVCTIRSCSIDNGEPDSEYYDLDCDGFGCRQIYSVNDLKKYISPSVIKEVVQEMNSKKNQHQVWGLAKKVNKKWEPRLMVFYKTRKEARQNRKTLMKIRPDEKFKVIKVHIDTKEKA